MKQLINIIIALFLVTAAFADFQFPRPGKALEIGENIKKYLAEPESQLLKTFVIKDKNNRDVRVEQKLKFPPTHTGSQYSGSVIFDEDEHDDVGHYLFWDDGDEIFTYELNFKSNFQSRLKNIGQNVYELTDLYSSYNKKYNIFNVLGESYYVSNAYILGDEIHIGLMNGVLGEIELGNPITFIVDSIEYETTLMHIGQDPSLSATNQPINYATIDVNGEIISPIIEGNGRRLANGAWLKIIKIDEVENTAEIQIASKTIGLNDDNYKNNDFDQPLALQITTQNPNDSDGIMEDSAVQIKAKKTGNNFRLKNIQIRLHADAILGDMYIPPGRKLSEYLDEPLGMISEQWDLSYEGVIDTGVTLVRVDAAGNDEYDIEFTNQEGIFFDFPLASAEAGSPYLTDNVLDIKFGDDDDDLWYTELVDTTDIGTFNTAKGMKDNSFYISDDDFFIVSDCTMTKTNCFTHVLRYDSIDTTSKTLTFTDLGTGTRQVVYDSSKLIAELVVGGITYKIGIQNDGQQLMPPFNLSIDLNGNSQREKDTAVLIGILGNGILALEKQRKDLGHAHPIFVSGSQKINLELISTLHKNPHKYEKVKISIEPRPLDQIGISGVGGSDLFGLFDLDNLPTDEISQGLSRYGVFFEMFDPENGDSEDLIIEYPLSKRGAKVLFVEK